MPPDALAISYTPPDRAKEKSQRITPLAPVGMQLLSSLVVGPEEEIFIQRVDEFSVMESMLAPYATHNGKLLPAQLQKHQLRLVTQ